MHVIQPSGEFNMRRHRNREAGGCVSRGNVSRGESFTLPHLLDERTSKTANNKNGYGKRGRKRGKKGEDRRDRRDTKVVKSGK